MADLRAKRKARRRARPAAAARGPAAGQRPILRGRKGKLGGANRPPRAGKPAHVLGDPLRPRYIRKPAADAGGGYVKTILTRIFVKGHSLCAVIMRGQGDKERRRRKLVLKKTLLRGCCGPARACSLSKQGGAAAPGDERAPTRQGPTLRGAWAAESVRRRRH